MLFVACDVEFAVEAVVAFAVEVAAFAVEVVACTVEAVAFVVARVAAEEALSALLTDGVLTVAAELNLAELARPRRACAKE